MIALLLALAAIVNTGPPPAFLDGFLSGHPVVVEGFTGWEWDCTDEMCCAGLSVDGWSTGP